MNYLNKKIYLWILILFSALVYFITYTVFPISKNTLFEYFRILSIVVTVDSAFIWLFINYLWKWTFLYDWVVPFPDLNGTWEGELKSSYIDKKTNKKIDPIKATLKIRQSFVHIHCLLKTEAIESSSFVCQFDINKDKQKLKLVYSYGGEANLLSRDDNPNHFGTAMLSVNDEGKALTGSYWTDRKTTGELTLIKSQND